MELGKVSKAIAGSLAAGVVALLAKYSIVLAPEVNSAVSVLLDFVVAAVIGWLAVYWAPKNK